MNTFKSRPNSFSVSSWSTEHILLDFLPPFPMNYRLAHRFVRLSLCSQLHLLLLGDDIMEKKPAARRKF